jgi:hypothetical protein
MTGLVKYVPSLFIHNRPEPDMRDCYTCSFTEFLPFCVELYYFSNFKDFNWIARDQALPVLG